NTPKEVIGPLRKGDRVSPFNEPGRTGTITYEEDGMARVRFDDNPNESILSLKKLARSSTPSGAKEAPLKEVTKPTFSAAAREKTGMKSAEKAKVKAEADAVAPKTAPPSDLENWKAELEGVENRLSRSRFSSERDKLTNQKNVLRGRIADAEREVTRSGLPLTEPEEKLVTDPDANKWKYQAEYFVKALEPVKDAWLSRFNDREFGG